MFNRPTYFLEGPPSPAEVDCFRMCCQLIYGALDEVPEKSAMPLVFRVRPTIEERCYTSVASEYLEIVLDLQTLRLCNQLNKQIDLSMGCGDPQMESELYGKEKIAKNLLCTSSFRDGNFSFLKGLGHVPHPPAISYDNWDMNNSVNIYAAIALHEAYHLIDIISPKRQRKREENRKRFSKEHFEQTRKFIPHCAYFDAPFGLERNWRPFPYGLLPYHQFFEAAVNIEAEADFESLLEHFKAFEGVLMKGDYKGIDVFLTNYLTVSAYVYLRAVSEFLIDQTPQKHRRVILASEREVSFVGLFFSSLEKVSVDSLLSILDLMDARRDCINEIINFMVEDCRNVLLHQSGEMQDIDVRRFLTENGYVFKRRSDLLTVFGSEKQRDYVLSSLPHDKFVDLDK